MDKSIKGTQTEKNLLKAFAGESQAKNRYTFFSEKAKEEDYEQIAELFMNTALQEEQHAKKFFKFLEGGLVEITAAYPAGSIDSTVENLRASAMGEHEEWNDLYPHFAEIAEQEGFSKVATAFKLIASIEREHEKRYKKLLEQMEKGQVSERENDIEWACRMCGYVHKGEKALMNCPVCDRPEIFFEEYELLEYLKNLKFKSVRL